MYQQYLGIVTPNEAHKLKNMGRIKGMKSDFSHELIQKVAKRYQSIVNDQEFILQSPSYWRVETRPKGHKWHFDGCKLVSGEFKDNHMAWCQVGTTVLLSDPDEFTGGRLFFEIDGEPTEVKDHYLNGVCYTAGKFNNPVRHMVEPHKGKRTVLLMFFATKPVSKDQLKGKENG